MVEPQGLSPEGDRVGGVGVAASLPTRLHIGDDSGRAATKTLRYVMLGLDPSIYDASASQRGSLWE